MDKKKINEVIEGLTLALDGSCNCEANTSERNDHAAFCRYTRITAAIKFLEQLKHAYPVDTYSDLM